MEFGNAMTGVLAALGSTASWALCGVLFKRLGERLDPVGMTAAKSLVSVVALLPLVWWMAELRIPTGDLLLIAASGVVGIAVGDSFFFAALGRLSPLMLTVLLLTCPDVVTGLMGIFLLGEMPSLFVWAGICSVMAATVLLALPFDAQGGKSTAVGVVYALLSIICSSVSTVIVKPVMTGEGGISPFSVTFYRMATAAVVLSAFACATRRTGKWSVPFRDMRYLAGFAGVTALVAYGGFGLSMAAFRYLDIVAAGALLSLEPVFVLPFMVFFAGHKVRMNDIVGMLLAVAGVLAIALGSR